MTRLIDNMERQHLVVRISDKKDRRTNLIHLTKDGKELEERARVIANQTLKEALTRHHHRRAQREPGSAEKDFLQYERLSKFHRDRINGYEKPTKLFICDIIVFLQK